MLTVVVDCSCVLRQLLLTGTKLGEFHFTGVFRVLILAFLR